MGEQQGEVALAGRFSRRRSGPACLWALHRGPDVLPAVAAAGGRLVRAHEEGQFRDIRNVPQNAVAAEGAAVSVAAVFAAVFVAAEAAAAERVVVEVAAAVA